MQIKVYYLINYWTMYRTTQFLKLLREMGEQGWSILTMDGAMARGLSFQECGLGSVPRLGIIHVPKWVEFVDSLLCSGRPFSRYSGFPAPQKPTFKVVL